MSRLLLQYMAALTAAMLSFWVLRAWRGFYVNHAFIVSLAVGALVFATWRTVDRMRG